MDQHLSAGRAVQGADPSLDVDAALVSQQWDYKRMVKTGESFYTSLGLDPLPATFWERSMFVKPRDREVICHASAWDVQNDDDLRIKLCIKPTETDLQTIHHELGHNYYQHYHYQLPYLLQGGAHGFKGLLHECSVYGNRAAGDRLRAMLALGHKKPWPEALQAMTGQREMDATALLDYFAPLQKWLKEENAGQRCGW